MILQNELCNIKIAIDETFTVESTDNMPYDLVLNPYQKRHDDLYKVFTIEIDRFYKIMRIALVGDFYSYDTDCALLDGEILTVLQNDTVSQIRIIDGTLIFTKKFDCFGCNYGIYKVKQGYIVYGEIEILMLDFDFNIRWKFSGRDIFVSVTGKNAFELCENSIKLYDFEDNYYEIDFNGNRIG